MVIDMRAIGYSIKGMDLVYTTSVMGLGTKATGAITNDLVLEPSTINRETRKLKASGSKTNFQAQQPCGITMAVAMKDNASSTSATE